jgi:hypothetical protein
MGFRTRTGATAAGTRPIVTYATVTWIVW